MARAARPAARNHTRVSRRTLRKINTVEYLYAKTAPWHLGASGGAHSLNLAYASLARHTTAARGATPGRRALWGSSLMQRHMHMHMSGLGDNATLPAQHRRANASMMLW